MKNGKREREKKKQEQGGGRNKAYEIKAIDHIHFG